MEMIYFLGGIFLGAFLVVIIVWLRRERSKNHPDDNSPERSSADKRKNNEKEKTEKEEVDEEEEEDLNLESFNDKRQTKVEKRKKEILEKVKKEEEIQTKEVMEMFRVSRATAFRYLEDLEKEGKISQAGKAGRKVRYRIKS